MATASLLPTESNDAQELDEELQKGLLTVIQLHELEDQPVRDIQLRLLKKYDYYWKGVQAIFWSDIARDWQNLTGGTDSDNNDAQDVDPAIFTKIINIYRAHGEAIISALSAGLPYVRFFPDDADNPDDVITAKAYNKIAQLVQKHNKAEMLFLKALYYLYNGYFAAAFNMHYKDREFGTTTKQIMGSVEQHFVSASCPNCGNKYGEDTTDDPNVYDPAGNGVNALENPPLMECPACEQTNPTEFDVYSDQVPVVQGTEEIVKGREIIEIYGPMHVKVASYVSRQEDTPYLIFECEQHYTMMEEIYPSLEGKLVSSAEYSEKYDKWARSNTEYAGDSIAKRVTVRRAWLRPWAFNILDNNDALKKALKAKFPKGCCAIFCNDEFAEAYESVLDEHWTLTINPLATHIHAEALGEPVVQIQEMRNELINLMMQSIQYGIPETFADTAVLDFDKYRQVQAKVGQLYPVKVRQGQNISESFHTLKAATYPEEAQEFLTQLDKDAQFVVGSFPSIYGGQQTGGSKTLGEYEMSRNQALQRLSTIWKMVNLWWTKVIHKAVKSFAANMEADEKMTEKAGFGFVSSWIRMDELKGKVGDVEPEASEQFPISWDQKRSLVYNLLSMNNPQLEGLLLNPTNASFIARILGGDDLVIPGEDDEDLQKQEIADMLHGIPVDTPMEIVDHQVHAATCKAFLVSLEGQDTKKINPAGYAAVLEHFKAHVQALQGQQASAPQPQPGKPGNPPPMPNPNAPKPSTAVPMQHP